MSNLVLRYFQSIAPYYDRNNALLSFGLHKRWNRSLVTELPKSGLLLDLCAGTGAITFLYGGEAIALDFCGEMLEIAKKRQPAGQVVHYIQADAQAIPLAAASVAACSTAYGIRNIPSPLACAQEVYRVLQPGGLWAILELTRPTHPIVRLFHRLHLKITLPLLGRLLSNSREAYRHLSESVQHFISPSELSQLCESVGFHLEAIRPLTYGAATLLLLRKGEVAHHQKGGTRAAPLR